MVPQMCRMPPSSPHPGPGDTGYPATELGQRNLQEAGLWVWVEECRAGLPVAAVDTYPVLPCQRLERNLNQQHILHLQENRTADYYTRSSGRGGVRRVVPARPHRRVVGSRGRTVRGDGGV